MDPDAKIGPSQSKARRRTAEIGPLKSKARLHTSTTDYSDLNSIQEQLTASTQRMEELHKAVTESSRPSHKANFACYIKGEILNMTDIQFIRAKPRFLAFLKKLERESETPPISTGEQYVCEVPDLRSIPVCLPATTVAVLPGAGRGATPATEALSSPHDHLSRSDPTPPRSNGTEIDTIANSGQKPLAGSRSV